MKVFVVSLIALVATLTPACAVIRVCPNGWSTDKAAGAPADDNSLGITCSPKRPIATQCPNHINAACVLSYKTFSYKCCGDVLPSVKLAAATADPSKGMGGLDGTAKPKCPNGAISQGGNNVVTCDPVRTRCLAGFTCASAANANYTVYTPGTATTSTAIGTAFKNPYLCCKTSSLTGKNAEGFISSGLVPSIVPIAPTEVLESVTLSVLGHDISLGDDWSAILAGQELKTIPLTVNLNANQTTGFFYHVLIFDSTTNKDVIYFGVNLVGDGTKLKRIALLATGAVTGTTGTVAYVYFDSVTSTTYKYSASYQAPTQNTVPHRFVALVWESSTKLLLDLTTAALEIDPTPASPLINMGDETFRDADFVPVGTGKVVLPDGRKSGLFTTVTAFLNGKGQQLGTPLAGTYFYLKN